MAQVKTRLVKVKEVCTTLGICDETFARHWQGVFTETRGPKECKKGAHRRIYEDELAEALNAGGGTASSAKAAVLTFRRTMGRL